VAPLEGLVVVLDRSFFPKWLKALQVWMLTPDVDLSEVLKWYEGWKTIFPQAIAQDGRVQRQFVRALAVVSEDESAIPPEIRAPAAPEPAARTTAAPAGGSDDVEGGATMRDVLEKKAIEHGLTFRPKQRSVNGNPVFAFGKVSLYVKSNVVYEVEGTAGTPISVSALLKKAK
jgi:tuftelin-interacting protein 11